MRTVGGIIAQPQGAIEISDYTFAPVQPVSTSTILLAGLHESKSEDPKTQLEGKMKALAGHGLFEVEKLKALARENGIVLSQKDIAELKRIVSDNPFLQLASAGTTPNIKVRNVITASQTTGFGFDVNVSALPHYRGVRGLFFRAADMLGFGQRAKSAVADTVAKGVTKVIGKEAFKKVAGFTLKGAVTAAAEALGFAVGGPIGTAIVWLVTQILGKVINWLVDKVKGLLKKLDLDWKQLLAAGAVAAGLAFGAPALAIGGGLFLAAPALAAVPGLFLGSIAKPLIISMVSIPVFVALILFIINSGAYLVPSTATSFTGTIPIIAEEGCPTSWPVNVDPSLPYTITQGPGGDRSHGPPAVTPDGVYLSFQEAIDIAPANRRITKDDLVYITHPGKVVFAGVGYLGGNAVRVEGNCGGQTFYSLYVHMSTISVYEGQLVQAGEAVGLMGKSGWASAPHVHYEFENSDGSTKDRSVGNPPPYMTPPYIPKDVPLECDTVDECGVFIP